MKFNPSMSWTVVPTSAEHIPIYVFWVQQIAGDRQLDSKMLIAQIEGELKLAATAKYAEHYTGIYEKEPGFFMNGYLSDVKGHFPGDSGMRKDFRMDLLMKPAYLADEDLCLRGWHEAIQFIFDLYNVGRVIVEANSFGDLERRILLHLSFEPMEHSTANSFQYQYLVCRRADFRSFIPQ